MSVVFLSRKCVADLCLDPNRQAVPRGGRMGESCETRLPAGAAASISSERILPESGLLLSSCRHVSSASGSDGLQPAAMSLMRVPSRLVSLKSLFSVSGALDLPSRAIKQRSNTVEPDSDPQTVRAREQQAPCQLNCTGEKRG